MEMTQELKDLLAAAAKSGADQAVAAIKAQSAEEDKLQLAVKAACEPLLKEIEALKAKGPEKEDKKETAEELKKAEEAEAAKSKKQVDDAIKSTLDAAAADFDARLKSGIEEALEKSGVLKGLKGGLYAPKDNEGMTATKAMSLLNTPKDDGTKWGLGDFSEDIQSALINLSEASVKSMFDAAVKGGH